MKYQKQKYQQDNTSTKANSSAGNSGSSNNDNVDNNNDNDNTSNNDNVNDDNDSSSESIKYFQCISGASKFLSIAKIIDISEWLLEGILPPLVYSLKLLKNNQCYQL